MYTSANLLEKSETEICQIFNSDRSPVHLGNMPELNARFEFQICLLPSCYTKRLLPKIRKNHSGTS